MIRPFVAWRFRRGFSAGLCGCRAAGTARTVMCRARMGFVFCYRSTPPAGLPWPAWRGCNSPSVS